MVSEETHRLVIYVLVCCKATNRSSCFSFGVGLLACLLVFVRAACDACDACARVSMGRFGFETARLPTTIPLLLLCCAAVICVVVFFSSLVHVYLTFLLLYTWYSVFFMLFGVRTYVYFALFFFCRNGPVYVATFNYLPSWVVVRLLCE